VLNSHQTHITKQVQQNQTNHPVPHPQDKHFKKRNPKSKLKKPNQIIRLPP
jgi:hypothetical protein